MYEYSHCTSICTSGWITVEHISRAIVPFFQIIWYELCTRTVFCLYVETWECWLHVSTDSVGHPSERAGAFALLHDGDLLRLVLPNQRDPRHRRHGLRRLPGRGPQTGGGTQTTETSTWFYPFVQVIWISRVERFSLFWWAAFLS